jgi:hypothetical protein
MTFEEALQWAKDNQTTFTVEFQADGEYVFITPDGRRIGSRNPKEAFDAFKVAMGEAPVPPTGPPVEPPTVTHNLEVRDAEAVLTLTISNTVGWNIDVVYQEDRGGPWQNLEAPYIISLARGSKDRTVAYAVRYRDSTNEGVVERMVTVPALNGETTEGAPMYIFSRPPLGNTRVVEPVEGDPVGTLNAIVASLERTGITQLIEATYDVAGVPGRVEGNSIGSLVGVPSFTVLRWVGDKLTDGWILEIGRRAKNSQYPDKTKDRIIAGIKFRCKDGRVINGLRLNHWSDGWIEWIQFENVISGFDMEQCHRNKIHRLKMVGVDWWALRMAAQCNANKIAGLIVSAARQVAVDVPYANVTTIEHAVIEACPMAVDMGADTGPNGEMRAGGPKTSRSLTLRNPYLEAVDQAFGRVMPQYDPNADPAVDAWRLEGGLWGAKKLWADPGVKRFLQPDGANLIRTHPDWKDE